jgi:hypothetical protein
MKANDHTDTICIHRKMFNDPVMVGNGTLVHIYYKFNHDKNDILVEDYSVQFIIDGEVGLNVADKEDLIDDDLYQQLFKETYHELINNVILKK